MLACVVPHDTWPIIRSPAPFGADQLDGAFNATAFLSVVGGSFDLTCAYTAGLNRFATSCQFTEPPAPS